MSAADEHHADALDALLGFLSARALSGPAATRADDHRAGWIARLPGMAMEARLSGAKADG